MQSRTRTSRRNAAFLFFDNNEISFSLKLDFHFSARLMILLCECGRDMNQDVEDWWDDLIAAERLAVYKVGGDLRILLHHDFDDASVQLLTVDEVLYRIRQALEKGVSISINLETRL